MSNICSTGRAHPKLATDVAQQLGIDVLETTAYDFANGEMYVRYTESVRGADVFVLQSHSDPVNDAIMEQLIMIDALKRASARSITAVSPLLGYSRQDKKHRGREPISCRLVFDLLKTAGADRIMSVDLHAAQSQGFFDGPVDHLIAMPVLSTPCVATTVTDLAPDSCSTLQAPAIVPAVSIRSSTSTQSLPLTSPTTRLATAWLGRVMSRVLCTNASGPPPRRCASIAPLLASAIKAVFEDGSVAELFDTYPEHHGKGFLFA